VGERLDSRPCLLPAGVSDFRNSKEAVVLSEVVLKISIDKKY